MIAVPGSIAAMRDDGAPAPARSRHKLDGIEGARGVAATLVVLYHASNHVERNVGYKPLWGAAQFGHAGVDFFFVLSGFIIWYVHAGDLGKPARLPHYLERRFTRIYPVYWFVTLLTLVLGVLFSSHVQPISEALYGATLLPTYDEPYIGVAWTLQHELMFYLLFAIGILNAGAGLVAFASWFLIVVALHGFGLSSIGALGRFSSSFNIEFFFGMFAAWMTRSGLARHRHRLLVAGIVLFGVAAFAEDIDLLDGFAPSARLAYGLPAILLVIGTSGMARTTGLVSRGFMLLGKSSYSIYLSHLLFIGIFYKALEVTNVFAKMPPVAAWLAMSAAGVVGGILLSRFVEYPLMGAVRRRLVRAPLRTA